MKREDGRRTNMKRSRGRGRRPGNSSGRSLDSNGPQVKIRGSAPHILEKYQALARDASLVGDLVAAENYMQHAEHYLRLLRASQGNAAEGERAAKPDNSATNGADSPVEAEATEGNGKAVDDGKVADDAKAVDDGKAPRRRRTRRQSQGSGASSQGPHGNGQAKSESDADSEGSEETTVQ